MRHYGRYIGEKVFYPSLNGVPWEGEVAALDGLDNNRCTVRLPDGHETRAVAEWCRHIIEPGEVFFARNFIGTEIIRCLAQSRDGVRVTAVTNVGPGLVFDLGRSQSENGRWRIVWTHPVPELDYDAAIEYVKARLP